MRIRIIFYVTGQKIGTQKSCRGIEQVREARRRKIKPFLLESDPEKLLSQLAVEGDYTTHKIGLGKPRTIALFSNLTKNVSEINLFKKFNFSQSQNNC